MSTLRTMTPDDVPAVIDLQCEFLEGSIVTELGPGLLKAFHGAALAHPSTHAFVVHVDGALAGFIVGSRDMHAFNAHVKPRILIPLALSLFTPRGARLAGDLIKGLRDREPEPYIPAELLLLVVDGRVRRRGIGQQLLEKLEAAFAASSVTHYRVAVRSHLTVAKSFYQATGFEPEQEMQVLGRPMTYLTKRISQ